MVGDSTFTTSAPIHASAWVHEVPASYCVMSRILSPSSAGISLLLDEPPLDLAAATRVALPRPRLRVQTHEPRQVVPHQALDERLVETFDRLGPILGALVSAGTYLSRKFRERRLGRGYHWALFSPNGAALERIGALVDEGRIRPVIDRTFSFDDMIAAHELVESRRARGKVVIRVEE